MSLQWLRTLFHTHPYFCLSICTQNRCKALRPFNTGRATSQAFARMKPYVIKNIETQIQYAVRVMMPEVSRMSRAIGRRKPGGRRHARPYRDSLASSSLICLRTLRVRASSLGSFCQMLTQMLDDLTLCLRDKSKTGPISRKLPQARQWRTIPHTKADRAGFARPPSSSSRVAHHER